MKFEGVDADDRLIGVALLDEGDDVLLATRQGKAIRFAADRLRATQERHGRDSVGVITSSRCTNEETYLVQKLARAVMGNNNTDTCARVCHSPTGYGLGKAGWVSAFFQDADDIPLPLLEGWIEESYRAVAPKTLVKALQSGGTLSSTSRES